MKVFESLFGKLEQIREALARLGPKADKAGRERMGALLDQMGNKDLAETHHEASSEATRLWVELREHDPKRLESVKPPSKDDKSLPAENALKESMDNGRNRMRSRFTCFCLRRCRNPGCTWT